MLEMKFVAALVLNKELSSVPFFPHLYELFWLTLSLGAAKTMGNTGSNGEVNSPRLMI